MVKLRYLPYACSALTPKLDALESFALYFGSDRTWLDLATVKGLAINPALKFLAHVKPQTNVRSLVFRNNPSRTFRFGPAGLSGPPPSGIFAASG